MFYIQSVLGRIGHQVSQQIVSDIMFCNEVGEHGLVLCEVRSDFFSRALRRDNQ